MRKEPIKKHVRNGLLVKLSLATIASISPGKAQAQNINCFSNLIFGDITTCGAAGTVTVRPDNSTTSTCVTLGGAPQSRGRCIATQSAPLRPLQVNVSSSATLSSGGNTMLVNGFNIVTNAGGTGTTMTAPLVNVPIGATLNVGASQAAGSYSGSITVTAILQ